MPSRIAVDEEAGRELRVSVKHHLRTPLTVVLGHAELLIDREHEVPPDVRQSLALILQAAQRLNATIAGVCDLMDMEMCGPTHLKPVDILALVTSEVATYWDRAAQRGVRLLVSGAPTPRCLADSQRLRRALRALLDNALTYATDRSTIRVALAASTTASGSRSVTMAMAMA